MSSFQVRLLGFASICSASLLAGCVSDGTKAFSPLFPDNESNAIASILARPSEVVPASNTVVAATVGEAPQLVSLDATTGAVRWSVPFENTIRPELMGNVVVTANRAGVSVRDANDGHELFTSNREGLAFVGAARSQNTLFFVWSVGAQGGARRVGIVDARDARSGAQRWIHEIEGVFGRPTVAHTTLMIPWDRLNIAMLDPETGVELARLRSTDDVIEWVEEQNGSVFYGQRSVYLLDGNSFHGNQQDSTRLTLPISLPGDPAIEQTDFLPAPGSRSARGKIRIVAGFAPGSVSGQIQLQSGHYFYLYYRYLFAFRPNGTLHWTQVLPSDALDATVVGNVLTVVGADARITRLDAETGASSDVRGENLELGSASLHGVGAGSASGTNAVSDLRAGLLAIARDSDNRLVAGRAYAVAELAKDERPDTAQLLLETYAQRGVPGGVREAIGHALRDHTTGDEHLLQALGQRYDFLEGRSAPAFEVIVPALIAHNNRAALPHLIRALQDHETPAVGLAQVARGIASIGGEAEVQLLRDFVTRYRFDSALLAHPEALKNAIEGILAHGGDAGREFAVSTQNDARTILPLKTAIAEVLELEERQNADRASRALAEEQRNAEEERRAAEAAIPQRLSQAEIREIVIANAESLKPCVDGERERNPDFAQLRLVFLINNDGTASEIGVAPASDTFRACVVESFNQIAFPRFRDRRVRGNVVLNLRRDGARAAAAQEEVAPEGAPWWWRTQRRAERNNEGGLVANNNVAWWHRRQATAATTTRPTTSTGGQPAANTAPSLPTDEPANTQPSWWGSVDEESETPETPSQPSPPSNPNQPASPPAEPPPSGGNWWESAQ